MKIKITPTNNESIVKFETDIFLTNYKNFEFNNIEEAKNSPLAQQLFHLPFVKKVYISGNFIAVEKYNIVEWKDVEQEMALQIENYIKEGGEVIKQEETNTNVPFSVYAESTPNPGVMKFVTNKKIVSSAVEFKSIDDTENSPLARQLFEYPFIKSLFIDENFISITKYDIVEWEEISTDLREHLRKYLEKGQLVISQDGVSKSENVSNTKTENKEEKPILQKTNTEDLDYTSQQIISILDEYIKPAVASDGGNIEFHSYEPETKKVKVILQGACSGCPSSTITLKNGIETMLKEMLSGKISTVEAINE